MFPSCACPTRVFRDLAFRILPPSQVSQPGQSRLRPPFSPARPSAPKRALHPSEHCFIVRVPGAKGYPGCETLPSLALRQNLFSHLLLLSSTRGGMEGGDLRCARRTRAFPGRAFREHRGPPSLPPISRACIAQSSFQFLPLLHSQAGREEKPSTARVQRGESATARCASKEGSPHCQPLTSYPFSLKHRTTASA